MNSMNDETNPVKPQARTAPLHFFLPAHCAAAPPACAGNASSWPRPSSSYSTR